jgi:hypothetical protein
LLRSAEIGETKGMSTPRASSLSAPHPSPAKPSALHGYDDDFFAWTQETARAILDGRFDEIDKEALADEVESLGKCDRREVGSRLAVIAMHMLKLKFQPERETRSWRESISEHRDQLALVLRDSPSLRANSALLLAEYYATARRKAARQTGLAISTFPETCPWTVAEVLGE